MGQIYINYISRYIDINTYNYIFNEHISIVMSVMKSRGAGDGQGMLRKILVETIC